MFAQSHLHGLRHALTVIPPRVHTGVHLFLCKAPLHTGTDLGVGLARGVSNRLLKLPTLPLLAVPEEQKQATKVR